MEIQEFKKLEIGTVVFGSHNGHSYKVVEKFVNGWLLLENAKGIFTLGFDEVYTTLLEARKNATFYDMVYFWQF